MSFTDMMQAMSNPQGYIFNMFAEQIIKEHPTEWEQAQSMLQGKSRKQQIAELSKLYKSRGMNLEQTARQYGVNL